MSNQTYSQASASRSDLSGLTVNFLDFLEENISDLGSGVAVLQAAQVGAILDAFWAYILRDEDDFVKTGADLTRAQMRAELTGEYSTAITLAEALLDHYKSSTSSAEIVEPLEESLKTLRRMLQ